jgi:F-type H+-transporting ATPase subunit beta
MVPVGDEVLGRLLTTTGNVGDGGAALQADVLRRPIHRPPPALEQQSAATAMFETGIKVLDQLSPLAQGGKAAVFGGASIGETVLGMELINAMVARATKAWRCSPPSASVRAKAMSCSPTCANRASSRRPHSSSVR